MKGIALSFFSLAVLSAVIGMTWGIIMAMTGDHGTAPAHAHLNLVGWVTLAIFGFYYHLVPQAAEGLLPRLHLGAAGLGVAVMVPGIALAVTGQGEALAAIGSILTLLSMLMFAAVVLRNRSPMPVPAE